MDTGGPVSSADEWNKGSCEVAISVSVVGVVVAPALAALTEVAGDVVAAPLEVVVAKGFLATLASDIYHHADVITTPVPSRLASVMALGLMGQDQEEEKRD